MATVYTELIQISHEYQHHYKENAMFRSVNPYFAQRHTSWNWTKTWNRDISIYHYLQGKCIIQLTNPHGKLTACLCKTTLFCECMPTSLLAPLCPCWWNSTGDSQQVEDIMKKQVTNYIMIMFSVGSPTDNETTSC